MDCTGSDKQYVTPLTQYDNAVSTTVSSTAPGKSQFFAGRLAWNMFPSHVSVTDFGIFAVVAVFGLIVTLLFLFDFVSTQVTVHVFFAGRILDS